MTGLCAFCGQWATGPETVHNLMVIKGLLTHLQLTWAQACHLLKQPNYLKRVRVAAHDRLFWVGVRLDESYPACRASICE